MNGIFIQMNDHTMYFQRIPSTGSDAPLDSKEEVILHLYNKMNELEEKLKEANQKILLK